MKYRHSFHAGNFADIHKHVTLLALIAALQRKEKGFLYLETHAGRGAYDVAVSPGGRGARAGLERVLAAASSPEVVAYGRAVMEWRGMAKSTDAYPGSPLIAASQLRPQDLAVLIERVASETRHLEQLLRGRERVQVRTGDGFEELRACLPPPERRGLVLIDPPYEDTRGELEQVNRALAQCLRRFESAVILVWYPIKDARDTATWQAALRRQLGREALVSELLLHPPDSRVALNGSGLLIVNAPHLIRERMQAWLPALQALLDPDAGGGAEVRALV
jgi:23S rRNA (adenine2030-N6)-methyltransferase